MSDEPSKDVCEDCHGTGQVCVGTSGSDADGNAAVMERCPSCGYGDDDDFGDDNECFDCGEPAGSCEECQADANCGEYGPHMGGGCAYVGSEQCDECPHYDRVFKIKRTKK